MRGAQEGRLVGLRRRELVDHPPAEDDDGAIADAMDLVELRGEEQDRRAGLGELADEAVDLLLGADVDPARRVVEEEGAHAAVEPPRDRHFLLVATRQAPHLRLGSGVDLEAVDGAAHDLPLAAHVDRPPSAQRGDPRQGNVLAHGSLHEQGRGAIGRHEDDPGPDRVGRVAECRGASVDEDLTVRRAGLAREHGEQLVLALALERRQPQHLPGAELEGDARQVASGAQVAGFEPRPRIRGCRRRRRGAGWRLVLLGARLAGGTEHERDDLLLRPLTHVEHADRGAVAQDRCAVAEAGDLEHAVRDEDDRPFGAVVAGDGLEHP